MRPLFPRWPEWRPEWAVALIAGTAGAVLLKLPVETIGSRFGSIQKWRMFTIPVWKMIRATRLQSAR